MNRCPQLNETAGDVTVGVASLADLAGDDIVGVASSAIAEVAPLAEHAVDVAPPADTDSVFAARASYVDNVRTL